MPPQARTKTLGRLKIVALLLFGAGACNGQLLDFTQVYVGFNGPSRPDTYFFESKEAAKESWLAAAMEPRNLDEILSRVNFRNQMLVAAAIGERTVATGKLRFERIESGGEVTTAGGPVKVDRGQIVTFLSVGVISEDCNSPKSASYPFAVAIVERPAGLRHPSAYFQRNFPDGCAPVKSGSPNNPHS